MQNLLDQKYFHIVENIKAKIVKVQIKNDYVCYTVNKTSILLKYIFQTIFAQPRIYGVPMVNRCLATPFIGLKGSQSICPVLGSNYFIKKYKNNYVNIYIVRYRLGSICTVTSNAC